MFEIAAEGEKFFVVTDSTVDGRGEESEFQFMIHYPPDACVGNEGEIAVS